jgi:two-component system sensor histidine kinase MprB
MSLRKRLALVAAAAVAIAVVLASVVSYVVVRDQLRSSVDDALRAQEVAVQTGQVHSLSQLPGISPSAGGSAQYVQIIGSDGNPLPGSNLALPAGSRAQAVANGSAKPYFADVHVGGSHLRELTFPAQVQVGFGGPVQTFAVQLARPLDPVDHVLSKLRVVLFLLCAGGIALGAALGRLAANRVLAPLAEVSRTAEVIGETDDLTKRIEVRADDEVGQLAGRFNTMLDNLEASRGALDESVRAQRRLVADASHELRTPVTSLRTNIEVLLIGAELSDEERRRLLADVVEQSEELSALVSDLIELARGDEPVAGAEDVRLDRVVEESVARARRNAPALRFDTHLEPVTVEGHAERLARAVNNLLDNAARHSPSGGTVEVTVDTSGVTVRDHGEGIDPAEMPHLFDRFFRGSSTRGEQGSGLGLAIVKQVVEQHGGSAAASNAPDGGALFTLRLPGVATDAELPEIEPQHAFEQR